MGKKASVYNKKSSNRYVKQNKVVLASNDKTFISNTVFHILKLDFISHGLETIFSLLDRDYSLLAQSK